MPLKSTYRQRLALAARESKEDSELTEKQVKHIMNKLIDFYRAKADTPKAKISELQKEK